ncbi:type I-E CRISPR-associated protein Cse1/CasA [Halomonas piscis]|uniref:Type I-E CRISPR-associated protein Cse1/CasA n=1 Tax=Halomonas piscis TaxID=3031727 RepID=A0ABY9Z0B7_9GAMM|nr:type I-E CRISPR-associated protein Cse1/CasA [Halomonas piscis]WNK20568.1 type I-E CRISPR-associated protein Cse1/CasA [Halomonas piscis]
MNLLNGARWLPCLMRDGSVEYRPPADMAHPDVINLACPRADFQAGAYQFLLGLLQTALPLADHGEWLDYLIEPPRPDTLQKAFAPLESAFELDGDGPRFMQDLDPLDDVKDTSVSALLIDSPGASTITKNIDLFVKRGRVDAMCEACAALALFTMQVNAPAGGAGIRVGLRGGGPLTTLVMPESADATLWQRLWLNVLPSSRLVQQGQRWTEPRSDDPDLFFWIADTRISDKKGTEVLPEHVHPLHAYWSVPRRFRLLIEPDKCSCDLCGRETDRIVRQVRGKKQGANYDGPWQHPLTPYRRDPKKPAELPLSQKGQPSGLGYRHWPGLVLNDPEGSGTMPAAVVLDYINHKQKLVDEERRWGEDVQALLKQMRLWISGYDLDKGKTRGWYSVEMPLVELPESSQDILREWVQQLTGLAQQVASATRNQIKAAWFKRLADAKGDMSQVDKQFFSATHDAFFHTVSRLTAILQEKAETTVMPADIAQSWYLVLRREALALFDDQALSGAQENMNWQRATDARRQLQGFLSGRSKGSKAVKDFISQHGFAPTAQTEKSPLTQGGAA